LGQSGHAMARPLAQYLSLFLASPLPIATIGAELASMQSDPAVRSALRGAFQAALDLANPAERQQLNSFQGCPISSSRHFERRVCDWFSAEQGFRIEESSLKRRWQHVPRGNSPCAYMSCHIGEQRALPQVPETLLCPDAAAAQMAAHHEQQLLLELGMFSFVARRL
ncbi:MAG TPA: hypothetical protein VL137_12570, partial [Polyangiaceae bacterium]|nr:hypothetical protein [Polyangiaceae bacterium]